MDGPWNDFQPQAPAQGPWNDFAQAAAPQPGGLGGIIRDFAEGIARAGLGAGPAQFGTMSPGEAAEQAPSGVPLKEAAAAIPPAQNRYAGSVGEAVGNPASWMGPGSVLLKAGGAALSGLAGQAGEDVGGTPGRVLGSLAGGAVAAKALGAKQPEAIIPTRPELKTAYNAQYQAARESDLKVDPQAVGKVAAQTEQELIREGFDPDTKIFRTLRAVQSAPEGSFVSAQNLDTLRKYFGRAARETSEGKPTPEAAQATIALKNLNKFVENIPENSRLSGDAEAYIRNTKLGNQNYQSAQQLWDVENRIKAAETNYEGSIAARLDNQLKAQFRPILKSEAKQRGLTDEQVAAIEDLNKGSVAQRAASQVGRFTPFSPVGFALHAAGGIPSALATGGVSVIPQALIGGLIHGARKFGEYSSRAQAQKIADLAAKRSALYQQRQAKLPMTDTSGNRIQLLRSGILGLQ